LIGLFLLLFALGLELRYKDIVFQGTQTEVEILGRSERVGFYNTFVARLGSAAPPVDVTFDCDAGSGDVHLIRGPHYRGVQFHAESILTEHGFDLVRELLLSLLDG
jgi:phenazine biosynthesis protein phzE